MMTKKVKVVPYTFVREMSSIEFHKSMALK